MSALIEDMKRLESAEDFLNYFALPYDAAVVNINRLHILKRFYQYLAKQGGIEGLPAASAFSTCREMLAKAYMDFLNSSGIEQKVFRVFQNAQDRATGSLSHLRHTVSA